MPRLNHERDGDFAEWTGTGTGTHWDKECESVAGDHEAGTERLGCNEVAGTDIGTDGGRQETWTAEEALLQFPTSDGWRHETDNAICDCCAGTTCCKNGGQTPTSTLNVYLFNNCPDLPGPGGVGLTTLPAGTNPICWSWGFLTGCACDGGPGIGNINVRICCALGDWSYTVTETCSGSTLHTQSGPIDKLCCTINRFWAEFDVTLQGGCCNGTTVKFIFTNASPLPTEPGTGSCELADPEARWWCVKQAVIGNRRICTTEATVAYDGPYDTQAECEADCIEPQFWCVEYQDEDEDGNPVGQPYLECKDLGTGDEIGQILSESNRTGIVVNGPWTEENCSASCPPCQGDSV